MSNTGAWLKSVKTKQLAVAKGIKTQMSWVNTSEAKQRIAAAKANGFQNSKSVSHVLIYPDSN